jgi:hypothetical protein
VKQLDPNLPLNCPKCGQPLRYIATKDRTRKTYLYLCERDGFFELSATKFVRCHRL